MNAKQVQTLRDKINAAWSANDRATADKLQTKLHAHFAAEAAKFMVSQEGQKHMAALMNRP